MHWRRSRREDEGNLEAPTAPRKTPRLYLSNQFWAFASAFSAPRWLSLSHAPRCGHFAILRGMPHRSAKPARSLAAYNAKRDFSKSPEPSGDRGKASQRAGSTKKELFFCVQKH